MIDFLFIILTIISNHDLVNHDQILLEKCRKSINCRSDIYYYYYYFSSESGFDDNLVKEAANKKNIKLMDIKEIVQPGFNC